MKRLFMLMAAMGFILLAQSLTALAATAEKITPNKGSAGKIAIIHGSELSGSTIKVKFGSTEVPEADVSVLNDKIVKVTVPGKDPTDPDLVIVDVTVDEIPVGELEFLYKE